MSDGEVFYHIRNGIRNTGMPARPMSDQEIWQLVAYLRNLPNVVPLAPEPTVALRLRQRQKRTMWAQPAARNVTRPSIFAGAHRGRRTWYAIRESTLMPSFLIFRCLIP
jgi:hypothetical protein